MRLPVERSNVASIRCSNHAGDEDTCITQYNTATLFHVACSNTIDAGSAIHTTYVISH